MTQVAIEAKVVVYEVTFTVTNTIQIIIETETEEKNKIRRIKESALGSYSLIKVNTSLMSIIASKRHDVRFIQSFSLSDGTTHFSIEIFLSI